MLLQRDNSLLLMVDFQAGLLPVIEGGQEAVKEAAWLGEVACLLEVPVWLTEQSPQKLGGTSPPLLACLSDYRLWQKQHFGPYSIGCVTHRLSPAPGEILEPEKRKMPRSNLLLHRVF